MAALPAYPATQASLERADERRFSEVSLPATGLGDFDVLPAEKRESAREAARLERQWEHRLGREAVPYDVPVGGRL